MRINHIQSVEYHWGEIFQYLIKVYGQNGEKVAFHMAFTGENGGLIGVLRSVTLSLSQHWPKNGISNVVSEYWYSLSYEEKLAADREYLEKYSHILPSDFAGSNGIRTRANFTEILKQHPWAMAKIKNTVR